MKRILKQIPLKILNVLFILLVLSVASCTEDGDFRTPQTPSQKKKCEEQKHDAELCAMTLFLLCNDAWKAPSSSNNFCSMTSVYGYFICPAQVHCGSSSASKD